MYVGSKGMLTDGVLRTLVPGCRGWRGAVGGGGGDHGSQWVRVNHVRCVERHGPGLTSSGE